jgi:hypothetical protein
VVLRACIKYLFLIASVYPRVLSRTSHEFVDVKKNFLPINELYFILKIKN